MYKYEESEDDAERAKWSNFSAKPKQTHNAMFTFASAFIFTLASVVVVSGNLI